MRPCGPSLLQPLQGEGSPVGGDGAGVAGAGVSGTGAGILVRSAPGKAPETADSPRAPAAIWPSPPSMPASEASSIGTMTVFWFGDCASVWSAFMYFSAIRKLTA